MLTVAITINVIALALTAVTHRGGMMRDSRLIVCLVYLALYVALLLEVFQ